jgi:nucleoside-diphosphate-sugar epimerase
MTMNRVFVAGATGAIGRRLIPILVANGLEVAGMTRRHDKAEQLRRAGVRPFVLDVFDRTALDAAVRQFAPGVVIHELTDLPANLSPQEMLAGIERNARIRREGTRNLVDAAAAASARRIVAQSIAWAYAPGSEPHSESDPLDLRATGLRSISVGGVAALENAVLHAAGMEALVLRYAHLYGPGTGAEAPPDERLSVHVDAAAHAAFLAIGHGSPGLYNVAEQNAAVTCEKARRELSWNPAYRLPRSQIGAGGFADRIEGSLP